MRFNTYFQDSYHKWDSIEKAISTAITISSYIQKTFWGCDYSLY